MKVMEGYLYHIKDEYFKVVNNERLMINHKKGHSRPSYLAIKDKEIYWFIPLSSKVEKYKPIIKNKLKKYGVCKGIIICKIAGKDSVVLIQNAFPIIEKYIGNIHSYDGNIVEVPLTVRNHILNCFESLLSLKKKGNNLFFTDIDSLKETMLRELRCEKSKIKN